MGNFNDRVRLPESTARKLLNEPTNMIVHLLKNEDGTFSLMYHIVCDHCDYCDTQEDARSRPDVRAIPAKENPYANQ